MGQLVLWHQTPPAALDGGLGTSRRMDYNSGETLPELEGVTAERSFPSEITGNVLTETIGVLASPDLHGVLVKCMYAHPAHVTRRDCYSRSAIIALHPRPTEFDC